MSLADNITARQEADEIIAFIGDKPGRFWEVLAAHAATKLPQKPVDEVDQPMSNREAQLFEQSEMKWGKHAGETIGEVPVSYLIFVAEGDEFTRKLRRYVASKMFARRQDEEGDDA